MLIADRYRAETTLHTGRHSIVYRATDTQDDTSVVIKALRAEASTAQEIEHFDAECALACRIDPAYTAASWSLDGLRKTSILVTNDLGADSLATWMKRRRLTLEDWLLVASGTADCIARIHAVNVIHADLNPDNIIWNPTTNQVRVIDFGMAARLASGSAELPSGHGPAELAHVSPEQTGRMNRQVDWRTDFYSLGTTLYALSTGRPPFVVADALEMVHCHIAREAPPPHEVDPAIPRVASQIISKLMAKMPADRYQSAAGLKHDIDRCRDSLRHTGTVSAFPLGQQDVSGKLCILARYRRCHTLKWGNRRSRVLTSDRGDRAAARRTTALPLLPMSPNMPG